MTALIRLTDIQLILLTTAAARANGSLLPPPDTLGEAPARIRKVVQQLIRRGLAVETELASGADVWRTQDNRSFGVAISDKGRAAIEVRRGDIVPVHEDDVAAPSIDASAAPASGPLPPRSKSAAVLTMLRQDEGATLDELVAATGWLPHTTRAALSELRKKGHAIERGKREQVSIYHLKAQA
ncbi:DUF3489 domain-containing protein [Sphingobium sp. AN641]|uniref:DUF3489 domain-containing protein n=1 Tax=Sphingobium sp. AN641 TaxID=3133443 RepID=UPI0030C0C444